MRSMILVVLSAIALLIVWLAVVVDDWRRDFRVNVAETSSRAADPALRPISTDHSMSDVVDALRRTVLDLENWSWESDISDDSVATVRLVRTTKLFRFKDDITVRVMDDGSERLVHAISRSRVGKGDLGQNPRNLRELFRELHARLLSPGITTRVGVPLENRQGSPESH